MFNRSIFIDSADLKEIAKWNATGIADGVTTNQYILLKDGVKAKDFNKVIKAICTEMGDKPVSVELTDSKATPEEMLDEAKRLGSIAENIVVKVPIIPDTTKSLYVINELAKANFAVNATTIMTFEQMVMAALAARHCKRPSFISIFWARSIEDHQKYRTQERFVEKYPKLGFGTEVNSHPKRITEETAKFLTEGGYDNPKIIVGSIRNAAQVGEAFAAGGHIVTVTPDVLNMMLFSQRSIETIEQFDEAWKEINAHSSSK